MFLFDKSSKTDTNHTSVPYLTVNTEIVIDSYDHLLNNDGIAVIPFKGGIQRIESVGSKREHGKSRVKSTTHHVGSTKTKNNKTTRKKIKDSGKKTKKELYGIDDEDDNSDVNLDAYNENDSMCDPEDDLVLSDGDYDTPSTPISYDDVVTDVSLAESEFKVPAIDSEIENDSHKETGNSYIIMQGINTGEIANDDEALLKFIESHRDDIEVYYDEEKKREIINIPPKMVLPNGVIVNMTTISDISLANILPPTKKRQRKKPKQIYIELDRLSNDDSNDESSSVINLSDDDKCLVSDHSDDDDHDNFMHVSKKKSHLIDVDDDEDIMSNTQHFKKSYNQSSQDRLSQLIKKKKSIRDQSTLVENQSHSTTTLSMIDKKSDQNLSSVEEKLTLKTRDDILDNDLSKNTNHIRETNVANQVNEIIVQDKPSVLESCLMREHSPEMVTKISKKTLDSTCPDDSSALSTRLSNHSDIQNVSNNTHLDNVAGKSGKKDNVKTNVTKKTKKRSRSSTVTDDVPNTSNSYKKIKLETIDDMDKLEHENDSLVLEDQSHQDISKNQADKNTNSDQVVSTTTHIETKPELPKKKRGRRRDPVVSLFLDFMNNN